MRRSSSCLMFARIASCRMNRLKSSRISFSLIVIWIFFGLIVAVAGLEPATSAILRRFANLASRHTVPLSCAADFLRHYVQQCGVSSRHRREGVSAHPVNLNLFSPFLDSAAACPPAPLAPTPSYHRNQRRSRLYRLEYTDLSASLGLSNMSKNVSPFIVRGRWRSRTACSPKLFGE